MPKRKGDSNGIDDPKQCTAIHNPGVWPYISRCIRKPKHQAPMHEDRLGNKWAGKTPEEEMANERRPKQ